MNKLQNYRTLLVLCTLLIILPGSIPVFAKIRNLGQPITVRPVAIRNIAYNTHGTIFAVPNFVSAGSVALFWVNEQGAIAPVPSRFSEKSFVRSGGLFYLRKKSENEPRMAFIALPELLSGYSVSFLGDTIVCAGGSQVIMYAKKGDAWENITTLNVGTSVSRAMVSPDGTLLSVLSDGKLFLFSMDNFEHLITFEPAEGSKFADIAFSHTSSKVALFEYQTAAIDLSSRVRIFDCSSRAIDRDLPYFSLHLSLEPGKNLPLLSYGPADSLIAVTVPATFVGKVYLIKSNDGTIFKEFKGFCHAFSPDGTLFIAQSAIFSTATWSEIGKIPRSTIACSISPTERVVITLSKDAISRFRIEE